MTKIRKICSKDSQKKKLMMNRKRVAVIGAGPSGLAAIKSCVEECIDVVCFERSGQVGGLWFYRDAETDKCEPSVMKSTIINTCKELSAYSDFPPPKDYPIYLHNTQMLKYFQMYAECFGLYQHIQYYCDVVKVVPSPDYDSTGKWILTVRNTLKEAIYEDVFDGVMVCTGHHVYPRIPLLKGQEKFSGKIVHSQSLKNPTIFRDKRVLVIGIGNSGADAAVEISNVASQVYLSTRRGAWISPKISNRGFPYDAVYNTRLYDILLKFVGWRLSSKFIEHDINQRFDHGLFGLKPKHHYLAQHPSGNDLLLPKLICGAILIRGDVSYFTEDGVIFEGDSTSTSIDVVVLATGYNIIFPFLPEYLSKPLNNDVSLYKYMLSPILRHPTLAFIGLIQPIGCIFPIAENQSRWFSLLMTGKVAPPSISKMEQHIKKTKAAASKRFVDSPRHTIEVDYVDFMDQIAEEYGVRPNLRRYFFTDYSLFWALLLNPCVAYQYRLCGPHSWTGAREAVLQYPSRSVYLLQGRKTNYKYRLYHPFLTPAWLIFLGFPLCVLLFVIFVFLLIFSYCWRNYAVTTFEPLNNITEAGYLFH